MTQQNTNPLRFISLSSGSKGNCFFVGNRQSGILIDAGISARSIKNHLAAAGIDLAQIAALFVTHAHADHIKGVAQLTKRYKTPVYTTEKVHESITSFNRNVLKEEISPACCHHILKNEAVAVSDFQVTPFHVSHDAADSVGYTVHYQDKRFTIATDLGSICDDAAMHFCAANYLVIEANYDEKMLREGSYPSHLKRRIRGKYGHLCNTQTAQFLAENYAPHLDFISLCHLSGENNTPALACNEVAQALENKGVSVGKDVQLYALPRTEPSQMFVFG